MNDDTYFGYLLESDNENDNGEESENCGFYGKDNNCDDNIEKRNTDDTEKKGINYPFPQNHQDNQETEEQKYLMVFPNNINNNESINDSINEMSMTEHIFYKKVQRNEDKEDNTVSMKEELSDLNIKSSITDNDKEYIGKKRENKNNKYTHDKLRKRVRIIALKAIIYFVNEKIKTFYKNIGKGLLEKQFKEIDKKNLSHSKVDFDKIFLEYKLKEIFSWNISSKITSLLKEHNKNLLDQLINSELGGNYFKELFEMTFSQCLEHIQGKKNYEILNGMMNLGKVMENFCDEKEINDDIFCENFNLIFMNYQELIDKKTPRKPKNLK